MTTVLVILATLGGTVAGTWFGATFATARRDHDDAQTPRHVCSYGCGTPTWSCAEPCPRCKADEAEQDAWLASHRHLTGEDRLLGIARMSARQSQQRRGL